MFAVKWDESQQVVGYLSRVSLPVHSIVNAPLKPAVGGSFGVDPS